MSAIAAPERECRLAYTTDLFCRAAHSLTCCCEHAPCFTPVSDPQESVDYVATHPDALMTSDEEDETVSGSNGAPEQPSYSFMSKRTP